MSFTWTEIHAGNLSAPQLSLAGRSDMPATSRGDAVAAVVQAGSMAFNNWSVNRAIEREKERQARSVSILFEGHRTGGLLAVAAIDVTRVGEFGGVQRFMHLELSHGIYARPRDAIGGWMRRRRQFGSLNSAVGQVVHRFLWITRA